MLRAISSCSFKPFISDLEILVLFFPPQGGMAYPLFVVYSKVSKHLQFIITKSIYLLGLMVGVIY
jgi:hypothetical protein